MYLLLILYIKLLSTYLHSLCFPCSFHDDLTFSRCSHYLFPDRSNGHISHDSAARILKTACQQVDIFGVSTHSFRRTALTSMSNAGIPLRVI
ncbi:tyrosine-type recombinase/integrase [Nostoc sp.]|uniref:tyrosine-type recombinase/integrase n=1 Tax=Nostoc sp. TaxID=1180 RepID=UPI003FA5F1C8